MRNALVAGALAVTLVSAAWAQADQSVSTYHGALDRAGQYVVPGLTYERARGLRLDASFHAAFEGHVYAQPLFWRRPGSGAGDADCRNRGRRGLCARRAQRSADLEARARPARSALRAPLRQYFAARRDRRARHRRSARDALSRRRGHARQWAAPRNLRAFARRRVDRARLAARCRDRARRQFRAAHCRTSAARWRCSTGKVFVPFSGHWGDCGAYHGFVVGVSDERPGQGHELLDARARRRHLGARRASAAMDSRCSSPPATLLAPAAGAMARPSCGSLPTSPARPRAATISPRRTGASSMTGPRPRRNRADPARCRERERRPEADLRHRQKRRGLSSRSRQPRRHRRRAGQRAGDRPISPSRRRRFGAPTTAFLSRCKAMARIVRGTSRGKA